MNNKKVQLIVMNAMIGAAYAVLTILISPIAYGAVQMRLTEIIVLLACYNKKFIPGLTIGCLLANLASPMGLYDICFGTAATLIACLGMYYVKNVFAGALIGGVVNGLIVGLELYLALELPFMINAFYVFIIEICLFSYTGNKLQPTFSRHFYIAKDQRNDFFFHNLTGLHRIIGTKVTGYSKCFPVNTFL